MGLLSNGPLSIAADVLIVCPPAFKAAMAPWVQQRKAQGRTLHWIGNEGTAEEIRDQVRKASRAGRTKFLLIVGDADPAMNTDPAVRAVSVPTHFAPAKVNIHWGKERDIATDNWYADLDDDQLPDLAVGRIPVDSADELKTVVGKILEYERSTDFSEWRRRVSFVACPGNFGGVIDTIIEQGARRLTTEGIPASYATKAMYGNWRSPYCPDPRRFLSEAVERINEGSLFWVYIGHGSCRHVDQVSLPDRSEYPILRYDDIGTLDCRAGLPIAIFLACYTGRFDDRVDSIAEQMLRTPGAPVGIIAATRVTMPYAMTVMGGELMKGYFADRVGTIGELFQRAKREMVLGKRETASARLLDSLAPTLNPKSPDLAAERMEHVLLFQLIGDPTMRLAQPGEVAVEPIGTVGAGSTVAVKGHSPIAGTCMVEFVLPRDRLTFKPPVRKDYTGSDELLSELHETYLKANDPIQASAKLVVPAGPIEATLRLPETASGSGYIRVYVQGEHGYAVGATGVVFGKPQSTP